jgi:chemotaxis protein methyltransferase CheR
VALIQTNFRDNSDFFSIFESDMKELTVSEINTFIDALKRKSNYDFSEYSIKSFTRRVEKLLADYRTDIDGLIKKCSSDPSFLEELVRNITVNTTEIFRDPELWKKINTEILPLYKNELRINIWHAGASTGQEVYTMLILLKINGLFDKSKIYASDLNSEVLETAESGKYKYREIDEYINNFNLTFDNDKHYDINDYFKISRTRNLIKVNSSLMDKAQYKKHDLTNLTNPFAVKYNIIFCRNVLIYFNNELQNKVYKLFLDSLFTGGALIVGKHEGILGDISEKFIKKGTIYIKK